MKQQPGYKGASIWIENDNGTVQRFDKPGTSLTAEEFKKLQALQPPDYGFIVIVKPKPHEITNPSYVPYTDENLNHKP